MAGPAISNSASSHFFTNALWLIPKYISKGQFLRYLFWAFVFFLLPEFIRALIYTSFPPLSSNYDHSFLQELSSRDSFLLGAPSAVSYGVLTSFLYRFAKDWILNSITIEKLKSAKSKSDLEALRNQVNPHFLFNSLNTLDQLIDIDSDRAKKYLHKLAHLYRYILDTGKEDLVPLEQEWQFLEDYAYLIQQRFGSAYQLIKSPVRVEGNSFLIPPATLQILVENAVKHNRASEIEPLKIWVTLDEKSIRIRNQVRKKIGVQEGFGAGLNNLSLKYKLLAGKEINVTQNDNFEVSLPLILMDKSGI